MGNRENVYEASYKQAIEMIEEGIQTNIILSFLTNAAEDAVKDTVSSILIIDSKGLLRNGASPRLPHDYLAAIDGLLPNPDVGTCAAAAATGTMVVTEDFCEDTKWAELRHLPLALGFKGAWSFPIAAKDGKVLGTFGTYYNQKKRPSQAEIEGIQLLSKAAALALERA